MTEIKINKNQNDANELTQTSMAWTSEELKAWNEAGLIPQELLEPSKIKELSDYLYKHKEILYKHYRRNIEEDRYQITVPPMNEWHNAPDIIMTDRKTGEISILEMAKEFELCEGVCLQIKAKEFQEWEKETANAKKLNKEQHETFKAALKMIGPEKPLSRKEIVTLIEEVRKTNRKPKKYRQSGHFIDQKLKYPYPKSQPSIFDSLLPETKQKIEESRFEVKAEGIKLTYAENKLVHALNLLLYEKSQNADPKSDTFYAGNVPSELVPYGVSDQKANTAVLKFKPAELYKAFMGSDEYSGSDVKFIISTLHQLEDKKVLIKYDRVKKVQDGKKTVTLTDRIEDFQSLIKVVSFIPNLSDKEKTALDSGDNSVRDSRGEFIIALNPIFTDQIDTKFIEFPEDTNRRLVIAAGGHNKVTASMNILMEYMLREMSASRYRPEINEDRLPYLLGLEKYVQQKRKKLIQDRINKDIQAIINIGVIISVEKAPNSKGGTKLIFNLNKEYE